MQKKLMRRLIMCLHFFAANSEMEEAYATVSCGIQIVNAWLLLLQSAKCGKRGTKATDMLNQSIAKLGWEGWGAKNILVGSY